MATANILLLKKVENLGFEGDNVVVRAGYARNFLLPRGFAIPVTRANKKQMEALKSRREAREVKELEEAREVAEKMNGLVVTFSVKTGENGKMFGAITAADLVEKLLENGIKLERKRIHLDPVKKVGRHAAKVKLHAEVSVDFFFEVVSENPIA